MTLVKLNLIAHPSSKNTVIYVEADYIVSVQEFTFPSGDFTSITLVNGDKHDVKESYEQITQLLKARGKLL